jgi:hypothetical protein
MLDRLRTGGERRKHAAVLHTLVTHIDTPGKCMKIDGTNTEGGALKCEIYLY